MIIPKGSKKLDWEVELAFVIGKRASYVSEADALSHVLGYMICNDVSERFWQLEGTGQWIKGKSAETFGPLGPWLVTADEIGDPQNLDMWLDVNGQRMQTGNTRTMIFGVATLVSFLSGKMVLEPGDVVTTGTPPGVGLGQEAEPDLPQGRRRDGARRREARQAEAEVVAYSAAKRSLHGGIGQLRSRSLQAEPALAKDDEDAGGDDDHAADDDRSRVGTSPKTR